MTIYGKMKLAFRSSHCVTLRSDGRCGPEHPDVASGRTSVRKRTLKSVHLATLRNGGPRNSGGVQAPSDITIVSHNVSTDDTLPLVGSTDF
ncbi:hypothetical protein PAXINDRAFT_21483 [Paxillus involutus ATCC 200175]|uniref:Unplaced genomic scaffold PAXINscaffold_1809, whole genome shotgun sequence n=1 Tax=Paxillus involutus ATCC 200175 TaxID=664439 RepID=A0A0C9ST95_PAXIN|nr:hypothetical protein PAXINDRAFT_21483 [Paxillus involutus ATCC 200175]